MKRFILLVLLTIANVAYCDIEPLDDEGLERVSGRGTESENVTLTKVLLPSLDKLGDFFESDGVVYVGDYATVTLDASTGVTRIDLPKAIQSIAIGNIRVGSGFPLGSINIRGISLDGYMEIHNK